jgi:microcystin-dependent protein
VAETTTINYGWTKPDPGGSPNTWGTTLNATTDKVDAKVYANEQGLTPIGAVTMYAGAAAPANWLLCNGATLSRAAPYDKLFAVIGTAFNVGTVAADSFMLPNLIQKYPLGAGAGSFPVGGAGGSFGVPITIANLPAHNHPASQDAHSHVISTGGHSHTISTGGHSHTISTDGHGHGNVLKKSPATGGVPAGLGFSGDEVSTDIGALGGSASFVGNLGGNTDTAGNLGGNTDASTPAVYTGNTGSGTSLNVVPPFTALYFIVRFQ